MANGKTGLFQNLVQSLFANLCIYHPGARNQPCHYILGFPTAFHNGGKCTEILNASIGAGTQKHIVNLLTQQRFSRLETHIAHRLHERGPGSFSHAFGSRNMLCDTHTHARVGTVCNHRFNIFGSKTDFLVEHCILITLQCFPIGQCLVPCLTLRSIFASFDVLESGLIRSNHTAAGTHLYTQIAQGQTPFHSQTAHSFSAIFHEISRSAAGRHLRHHIQCYIFCRHSLAKFAVDSDTHCLRTGLKDTLRGHYHFHLTRTDTESHCSHRPVGGSMRVTADNGHARQGQPAFRTYYMDNSVLLVHHTEMGQSKLFRILGQCIYLSL